VVLFTAHARAAAIPALQAGASAVLEIDASEEQVAAAVTGAFHELAVLPAGAVDAGESRALLERASPLTPREMEILSLLAAGDSNKTIAQRLSLSVHTVKFHISSILSKLGASSRTEAVTLGLRLGIVLF
jgi:DNA-binding NarL/FixJ family response regulator